MGKKDKPKKVNPKRERYAKFRKEKPTNMNFMAPEPTPEQIKQRQEDEMKLNRFWRFNRNPPIKELREKKLKDRK